MEKQIFSDFFLLKQEEIMGIGAKKWFFLVSNGSVR